MVLSVSDEKHSFSFNVLKLKIDFINILLSVVTFCWWFFRSSEINRISLASLTLPVSQSHTELAVKTTTSWIYCSKIGLKLHERFKNNQVSEFGQLLLYKAYYIFTCIFYLIKINAQLTAKIEEVYTFVSTRVYSGGMSIATS